MDREDCNTEYRLEESKSHLAISVKGIATSRVAEPGVLEEARGTVWLEQNDHGEHSRRWEVREFAVLKGNGQGRL